MEPSVWVLLAAGSAALSVFLLVVGSGRALADRRQQAVAGDSWESGEGVTVFLNHKDWPNQPPSPNQS